MNCLMTNTILRTALAALTAPFVSTASAQTSPPPSRDTVTTPTAHLALSTPSPDWRNTGAQEQEGAFNILLFLVDDMGWQDTSVPFWTERTPLNNRYHTPNMERLAARGMKFTQAYASAISSPSRCSLLTGMNAARHRVTNWTMERGKSTDLQREGIVLPEWNVNGLSPVRRSVRNGSAVSTIEDADSIELAYPATGLPQLLRDAGYHTIHCGKAHFGALGTPGEDPLNWGFDVNIAGHAAGGLATYLSEKNYGHNADGTPYALNAVPGLEKYWGTGTFITEALTQEALAALSYSPPYGGSWRGAPFFLYMSHYAVHIPIDRDPRFYPKYEAMGLDPREAAYASLVEGMDKSLGDLLDWLDDHGQTDNTIVIFMSDNGGLATQPEWRAGEMNTQNAPLRSGKGSLLEGGIRVPLIVSWPGVTTPGSETDIPVIIEDLFPTLLDMADIDHPEVVQPIDGRSIVPILKGSPTPPPPVRGRARSSNDRIAQSNKPSPYRGEREGDFFVWNFPNVWGNEGPAINLCCAIRQGDWKLIYHYDTGEKELYNIPSDIGEAHNLAAKRPRTVRRLSRVLGRYLRNVDAQRPSFSDGRTCPWPDE